MFKVGRCRENVAGFLLWSSLAAMALTFQIACDIFQEQAPQFPLTPLLLTSILFSTVCVALIIAMGRRAFPCCFHYYQPFLGGDTFTAMQVLGYMSFACGIMLDVAFWRFLMSPEAPRGDGASPIRGILSTSGVLLVFGNVMLMASVDHYRVQRKQPFAVTTNGTSQTRASTGALPPLTAMVASPSCLASAPNRTTVLVCIMTLVGNSVPALVAALYPFLTDIVFVAQLIVHLLCALLVHLYIGCRHTDCYRWFMPLAGGSWKLGCTQAFAWFTFAVGVQGSLFLIRVGNHAPLHMVVGVCATSFVSILSLLLFVRTWPFHVKKRHHHHHNAHQEAQHHASIVHHVQPTAGSTSWFVAQHGKFTASVVAVGDGLFLVITSYALLYPQELSPILELSSAMEEGLRVCQFVSAAFVLTLPPLTHSIGVLAFPGTFDLWAPFTGSTAYIALQGLGWSCYTASIICGIAAMSMGPEVSVLFACLVVFAQLFIHASLSVFDPLEDAEAENGALRSPRRLARNASTSQGGQNSPRESHFFHSQPALNGELLLSVLITASGFALRIMANIGENLPKSLFLRFSMICFAIAAPLAHASIRARNGPLLSPFQGPPEFVALQAVGWTLYTLSLLVSGISFAEGKSFGDGVAWPLEALIQMVPLSMIAFSALLWRDVPEATSPYALTDSHHHQPSSSSHRRKGSPVTTNQCASDLLDMLRVDGTDLPLQLQLEAFIKRTAALPKHVDADVAKGEHKTHVPKIASPLTLQTAHRMHNIAGVTVAMLSLAEVVLYCLAAYFSTIPERRASAAVLVIAGALCAIMTCTGVHAIVGPLVHHGTRYRIFMPFSGGNVFVVLQACAWGSFSASILIATSYLIGGYDSHHAGGSYALPLMAAGFLGAVGQFVLFKSIAAYSLDDGSKRSFFELHAEGSVAFLLFLATFTFQYVHAHATSLETALSPVAVVVTTTSIMLALPLAAIALKKTAAGAGGTSPVEGGLSAAAEHHEDNEALDVTPQKKKPHKRKLPQPPGSIADTMTFDDELMSPAAAAAVAKSDTTMEYFIIPLMTSFPIALLYVAYFTMHRYTHFANAVLQVLQYLFYMTICLVMLVIWLRSTGVGALQDLRVTFTTCILYMIPTIIVLPSYLVPLLFPCRSTVLWAIIITLFTIIPPPFNRIVLRPLLGAYTGYWCYEAVTIGNVYVSGVWDCNGISACVAAAGSLLVDFLVPVFWFVYSFSFSGSPEEHGHRRSPRFVAFFKKHFFDDACKYFGLRVVAEPSIKGRLNDPNSQFIFGFHPHGVFPATAMYLSETDAWKQEMGSNPKSLVTCHGATIIFNGPLLRDFVMAVGGRSVSRRSIERSQDEGNSVVIVVGGQAEMLLTGCSTKELHLVTHHLGLIRLAIRRRLPLVPIIVFGEHNILETLHCYNVQRWFLKRLGFPFPLLPMGKWKLPFPLRTTLLAAVGNPVHIPLNCSQDNPSDVALMAKTYFEEVARLFEARKVEGGLADMTLHLHNGLPSEDPRRQASNAGEVVGKAPPPPPASRRPNERNKK